MTNRTDRSPHLQLWVLLPVLGACLLWLSWSALGDMWQKWWSDPRYSHGILVPLFSAFLLWSRREMLKASELKPNWLGLLLIVAGEALRFLGMKYYVAWFQGVALLPELAGLALVIGGWPVLRWAAPGIAFLLFMIPLPYRVELALGYPLQRIATLASNFALQTFGLASVAEGNVIVLNDESRIGVVEACNGLGMLYMFFAFATATALVIQRPLLDRLLILLSAVPIALFANITRITVTGLLHDWVGEGWANWVYHDVAGWLMMPVALAVLWLELVVLSHLFIEAELGAGKPTPLGIPLVVGPGSGGAHRGKPPVK